MTYWNITSVRNRGWGRDVVHKLSRAGRAQQDTRGDTERGAAHGRAEIGAGAHGDIGCPQRPGGDLSRTQLAGALQGKKGGY